MDKIHVEKGSVQEILIIPLYGRKLCAEHFPINNYRIELQGANKTPDSDTGVGAALYF